MRERYAREMVAISERSYARACAELGAARESRAARKRFYAAAEELRAEDARRAESDRLAQELAELESFAILHRRDGLLDSAVQFERMAAEFRAEHPEVSARVIVPVPAGAPTPVPEPVRPPVADDPGDQRLVNEATRGITRSLFGSQRR